MRARFLWLLAVPGSVMAQVGEIPRSGPTPGAFIPPGYVVLAEARGHLNGDETGDVVVILGHRRERGDSALADPPPRLLLVLHGGPAGFDLAVASATAVLPRSAGSPTRPDPLVDLALARNVIVVRHEGGDRRQWRLSHRYRLHLGTYRLIGRAETSFGTGRRCASLGEFSPTEHREENYLTGRRYRYTIPEGRCVRRERREALPQAPLRLLEEVDAGAERKGRGAR